MKKNQFALIFLSVFLIFAVVSLQSNSANSSLKKNYKTFNYLPSGKFLKGACLSFDELLADLLWIKALGYFTDQYKQKGRYKWLYHIVNVTTTLDPSFEDPYEFSGVIFSVEVNDIEKSNYFLKKGMENVPQHHWRYWYLPFFIAFNYMYHEANYQTAAKYLEIAASFAESPAYLPLLVSRIYANTEDPGIAIPFLHKMIERASTPEMKKKLELRIKEIQVKQDIQLLTAARDHYKKLTGNDLQSLDDLTIHNLIQQIPQEPFGGNYFISHKNNAIQTTTEVDKMELHIDKQSSVPLMLQE